MANGIGHFIRQKVIPGGMSVTEAARRLHVGRPALSNLLNGRAALSPSMALRLEKTFGADRKRLLDLQAASERDRRRDEDRAVAVGTYVPDFLSIRARQIAEWAGHIDSRQRLPVLLRRLVHATGRELRHVDFPGFDNAHQHGWDGWVEAGAATPWLPTGRSGWELSTHNRPGTKADRDYQARTNMLSPVERAECSFLFVTLRNWEGKDEWVRRKEAAGDWKAVKAFDASDLEQWLETTVAPRIWLASELGLPTKGYETLDHFWKRWAEASHPPMTAAIFAPSVAAHLNKFKEWLEKDPGDRPFAVAAEASTTDDIGELLPAADDEPFTVAADSREEAVAFLACLFRHEGVLSRVSEQAVVFQSASALRTLADSSSPFIPIAYNNETGREIASLYRHRRCIVLRPRNAVDRKLNAAVELLGHTAFEQALADMGIERDRVDRLARESGRSPTVLRRRLSKIDPVKTPPWARDEKVARSLIPMTLVGAWHNGSKADHEVLARLADHNYDDVEKCVAGLLQYEDCPVWCVDQHRGVVSKIDAVFAISPWMTGNDITDFLRIGAYVLSESDPALEIPEDHRWAAGLYGKVREHSDALRTGIRETLVLLSVHGNALFQERLGVDVAERIADLVQRLLTPFTGDKLRSHEHDLPAYAEATPNDFLEVLEEDLRQPKPVLQELLKPTGIGFFDHPSRAGILWALERLAWNSRTLMRVVIILAELSQTKIDDNWANKPINSLSAIFRSWIPQTAALLDDRIKALKTLCDRFPDIGWQICIQQFRQYDAAFPNERPRWRNDAAGAGHGATVKERREFARKALDLAIAWPTHNGRTLGDLVEHLGRMPDEDQVVVWSLIDAWSQAEPSEKTRADLREKIRRTVLTRRGTGRGLAAETRDKARQTCEKLAPRDPIARHAWLFAGAWVEESADEIDDGNVDWDKREKRIQELRAEAMAAIWSARGFDGVLTLLAGCDAWTVGRYAASCAGNQQKAADALRACLSTNADSGDEKLDNFMRGFLWFVDESTRPTLIANIADSSTVDQIVRLFTCAPVEDQTWRLLDQQDRYVRNRYWRSVFPAMARFTECETNELIDRLLEAERPRAAFFAVRYHWEKAETSRLKRLLMAVVAIDAEPADQFRIEPHRLSDALDSLEGRPGVTTEEMADLEFACIEALDHSKHGIPNISRRITESPGFFVQVVALLYKRRDDGQDPPEWRVDDPKRRFWLGTAAFRLLREIKRIPGTTDEGKIDAEVLKQWVVETRQLCVKHGRSVIGDQEIGQLLSNAPPEEDGLWPCRPVCELLETSASRDINSGFEVGIYSARGVHSRSGDEGGKQERELSAKYQAWAERLRFDYPHVASILEGTAKGYDRDAQREDSEVQIGKRLEH